MTGQRAIVAMSGGVDSSVVAALLHSQGYEVIGITLQLYDHGQAISKAKACCAGQDIQDAKRVAETMGFAHYTLDYESRFKQAVIDDFVDTYLAGQTPIPCVRCNQTVKFQDLLRVAQDLGGDFLATGHYVQRLERNGKAELHCGADAAKDQSYFLFATTQQQLEFLRFPLGHQSKAETRQLAQQFGLKVAEKPDSQDICFVPTGNYAALVRKLRPDSVEPGNIVDSSGNVLGQHQGVVHYTVGQRRGLGIGGGNPLYVTAIRAESREVVVGSHAELATETLLVQEVNWLGDAPLAAAPQPLMVKIRSTRPPVSAQLRVLTGGQAAIVFDAPQFGVSPGQAAVFYADNRVLGGGWIA